MPQCRLFLLLLLTCSLLTPPSHAAVEQKLRVGLPNLPPLSFVDNHGQPQGFFVDLLNHIAQQEGWQLEYRHGGLQESFERLNSGEVDLLAQIGYTEERARIYDFSEQFVYLDWGVIITPQGSPIKSLFELEGVEIAAVRGSIFTQGLRQFLGQFHVTARLVEFDNYQQVFSAVASGEYRAGISGNIPAGFFAVQYPIHATNIFFSPIHITYAAAKGEHRNVISALDLHLERLKHDQGSIFYQLEEKWLHKHRHRLDRTYRLWGGGLLAGILTFGALSLYLRRQVRGKITELTAVNRELVRSREEQGQLNRQFQTLLNGIPDQIMLIGPDYRLLWMNQAASVFSGLQGDVGKAFCYQGWPKSNEPCSYCPVHRSFTSRQPQELLLPIAGKTFAVKTFPILDVSGGVESVIKLAIDITDKLKLREEADRNNRLSAVGELSTGIAHEINNPVGLILSNLAAVTEACEDARPILDEHYRRQGEFTLGGLRYTRMREELPSLLEEMHDSGKRISRIVEDLKDFARGSGAEQGPVDLNSTVRRAIRLVEGRIRQTTENFSVQLCDPSPILTGYSHRLEQVIVNLLTNACQALPDRNKGISVATVLDLQRNLTLIEVRDEGVGIAGEHLALLTTPFFTTRRERGGTGLGLSISHRIVLEHAGTMTFSSPPGEGTLVTLAFPLHPSGDVSS